MNGMEQITVNSTGHSIFFAQQQTAVQQLTEYQNEILDLFKHYCHCSSDHQKQNFKSRIYLNLAIYAQIEDEIFYPAIKKAPFRKGLLPELQITFDPLVELISQIDFQNPSNEMHDHNIIDLEKYFHFYVKVQRQEMFVKAEKLELNMAILGQKIHLRKRELLSR